MIVGQLKEYDVMESMRKKKVYVKERDKPQSICHQFYFYFILCYLSD